jgi:hypothetical protein
VNHSRLVGGGSNGSPRQSTRGYEPGSRLILLEELIPETPDLVPGKWIDLLMLAITGGRERTEKECSELLSSGSFELEEVVRRLVR